MENTSENLWFYGNHGLIEKPMQLKLLILIKNLLPYYYVLLIDLLQSCKSIIEAGMDVNPVFISLILLTIFNAVRVNLWV